MSNLNESTLEQMLKAMAKTNIGAIPDNMVYWSSASRDVWGQFSNCAVTTNSWELEVNFDD